MISEEALREENLKVFLLPHIVRIESGGMFRKKRDAKSNLHQRL